MADDASTEPGRGARFGRSGRSGRSLAIGLGMGLGLGAAAGALCGVASAVFLFLLDRVTAFREGHEAIVYALPVAGLLIGWAYERIGRSIQPGTNLVLDTIHEGGPRLPARMAPLVLVGTLLTHLVGGSAGREGTAVQMGAGLADGLAHRLALDGAARRWLLIAGVAGGFGSVFGTPIAGAVFGLELLVLGRLELRAAVPALTAAAVGHLVTSQLGAAIGMHHASYPALAQVALTPRLLGAWLLVAAAVAATVLVFIEGTHAIKAATVRWAGRLPLRMAFGGAVVVALWQLAGTSDYLGLGVPGILRAFHDPAMPAAAFAWKLAFTAITLGCGFLGGEVTPLFFIGAALGNALAAPLGIPLPLAAGVGLAAAFGAAANTPLALAVMATELLGLGALPHVAIVCGVAYLLTGHRGIYPAQRLRRRKTGAALAEPLRLSDFAAKQRATAAARRSSRSRG
jgi:H+/Cl- antiporter ClcA